MKHSIIKRKISIKQKLEYEKQKNSLYKNLNKNQNMKNKRNNSQKEKLTYLEGKEFCRNKRLSYLYDNLILENPNNRGSGKEFLSRSKKE